MLRRSLESAERPIMAPSVTSKRTSNRLSTYSASPSFNSNLSSLNPPPYNPYASSTQAAHHTTAAVGLAEIKALTSGLDRLENKHLSQQRYVPNERKGDELSKLALGAKVERALGRRMVDQDAVLRVKNQHKQQNLSEKGTGSVKA